MSKKSYLMPAVAMLIWWCAILVVVTGARAEADISGEGPGIRASGPLVKREHMKTLFSSEDGQISAARVSDGINGSYLLHFFTLEPNSLFLPALLHSHMVFYVHTGSGKLSWTGEDELKSTEITRGDVFRLEQGSFFFIHSNLETETERQKLRIHAIFVDSDNDSHEPATGPYSSIRDMVLGFDREVLKAAFKVPEEVIEELMNGRSPSAIVHGLPRTKKAAAFEMETLFVRNFLGTRSYNVFELNKKKKKSGAKLFNLFKADKDFENCNGWSTTVTRKKLSLLKGSNVGLFMVNLTAGSMMGPHWNPTATEIAVVLQGRGVVRVVCPGFPNETRCRNTRFEVEEGDVFVVPRFHPMAQMSFNNGTLVFVGFSTSASANHPQYLAGQASVLRTLDRDVLAMSFDIANATLDRLLAPQHESVILGCVSCADEELRIMEEERERTRKEAREKEEEETRRREEERKREEEARKREEAKEAEARRKEEEEEARKKEEAAAKREEEERMRKEEEEEAEARRKEKEEAARKREEEAAKREEEAARKEEEERRKEGEEEAEARRREKEEEKERREEEAAARQREEEEARQREEEAARKEEEERARREEEEEDEETRQRQQEQERRKQKQEEARKREEEKAKQGDEERRRQEEGEATRRHQEEEEARQREEQQEEGGKSEGERAAEEERRREEEAQREEEEERGGGQDGENDQRWGKILKETF